MLIPVEADISDNIIKQYIYFKTDKKLDFI